MARPTQLRRRARTVTFGRDGHRGTKVDGDRQGRDSEIYAHGPGKVLRVARNQRSLVIEADVMSYVRSHGYPAPEVYDAGDGYLVMERVDGPTMLEDAVPFRIGRNGELLASLHEQLHRIPAPTWLTQQAPIPGDRLLHRDLHPLNVLMSAQGPIVIDWANASRGAPPFDVVDTWVLFACGDPPLNRIEALLAPLARTFSFARFSGVWTASRHAKPSLLRSPIASPTPI